MVASHLSRDSSGPGPGAQLGEHGARGDRKPKPRRPPVAGDLPPLEAGVGPARFPGVVLAVVSV